ncbi:tautomerase family protein [Pseudochelatococcus sp. B33]
MPKIIVHAPATALDPKARQAIVAELTDFALDCEALPKSPFVKSTAWTYFNLYDGDTFFIGEQPAKSNAISVQIFVLKGGLDADAKKKLITGATAIFGRQLGIPDRVPIYVVIQEIAEANWGIFGSNPDLAVLRATPLDAPAI